MYYLAIDDRYSGMLRMKAGDMKAAVDVSYFPIQCDGDVAIANLHSNI